jgi:hypothetical protein
VTAERNVDAAPIIMGALHDGSFSTEDGSVPPDVDAALNLWAKGRADAHQVVAALLASRLLVPVIAVLDSTTEATVTGIQSEKDSHLATPIISGGDGRRGLPAFTSVAALAAWRSDARPVPTVTVEVARAALQEDLDAVVIDVAGPVSFTMPRPALEAIAMERAWVPAEADPVVRQAIGDALIGLAGLQAIELGPDPEGGDLQVVLVLSDDTEPLPALRNAAERLGAQPALRVFIEHGVALGYRHHD